MTRLFTAALVLCACHSDPQLPDVDDYESEVNNIIGEPCTFDSDCRPHCDDVTPATAKEWCEDYALLYVCEQEECAKEDDDDSSGSDSDADDSEESE